MLRRRNSLLSEKVEQLNEIIANKSKKISINKLNKNEFNRYFKDLPVSDQQLESSISISKNSIFK